MPIVLSYDDPGLTATLGGQASRYATNQVAHQDYLQRQARDLSLLGQMSDQQNQFYQRFNQPMFGGEGQARAQPQQTASQPYVDPEARKRQDMLGYVDQLEQGGHIGPDEAIRYKGIIAGGGNPFEQPTLNERIRARAADNNGLTPYQSASLSLRQSSQDYEQQRGQWDRQYRKLVAKRNSTRKAAADMTLLPEQKQAAQAAADAAQKKLDDLPAPPSPDQGAPPDTTNQLLGGVGGGKPTPESLVKGLLRANRYDRARTRLILQQRGYDPDNIQPG